METMVLVAALCIALLGVLWMWKAEREARKDVQESLRAVRETHRVVLDDLRRLQAIEEAAYGMYCDVRTYGTLDCGSPSVRAYERASDHYWKEEVDAL